MQRWLPYAALAVIDTVAAQCGARRLRRFTKPPLMPLLAATVLPGAGASPAVRAAAGVALAGSTAGDVALLGRGERAFLAGVGGFLVAHAGWLAACAAVPGSGGTLRRRPAMARPFVATYGAAAALLAPRAGRLRGPVLGYAAVLTAMGATALDTAGRLPAPRARAVTAGALLFLFSDAVLAANRFGGRPLPGADAAVMATYTAGQALLAAGLLGPPQPAPRTR